jgi:asparagine synthase (glutamine-hydrolysing)
MCGICGVYLFDGEREVAERDVTAMRDTMIHRGPDDAGNYVRGRVGLGHRRLSIVDLAGGHQPMSNEDGAVWVAFNGEIYNHRDLRPSLEAAGHVFRTGSDTEVIVHGYEEYGIDAFRRMNGMFGIAIYDTRRDRLVLARDPIGIKPLYYAVTREGLVFGSEIKALLAWPGLAAEVNWERVPDLLIYGSVYGEETPFRGIKELPAGHVLQVDGDRITIERFWDLPDGAGERRSEEEERAQVLELLRRAIRRQLMSDVPLGAFLSGGVDSSLIVALMAEMTDAPVKTFSIGFAEQGYNEFDYSRMVAERFRTDHEELVLDPSRFFDALPQLIWHHDEPIALAACIPLYFLSKATKDKATVILTGEGADELFLGYDKYAWSAKHARTAAAFQKLCPGFARETLVRGAQRVFGSDRLLLRRLAMTPGEIAASFNQVALPAVVTRLLDDRIRAGYRNGTSDFSARAFHAAPGDPDFLRQTSYMDFKTFLDTLLMKQDKMSMAASIESRVPFLDHELVEYGYRLGTDRKQRDGVGKSVLKRIAEDFLPRELIHRQKRGFPVPIVQWLAEPAIRSRIEDILLDPRSMARGIVKRSVLESYLREVPVEQRRAPRGATELIWNLLNLELWQRRFIDA